MSLKNKIKRLLRSRSLDYVRNHDQPGHLGEYRYRGHLLHYRSGSSDAVLMHDILFYPGYKAEYWVPPQIEPEVILDLGGNIGLASVYYANLFPGARIHSFEPVPENFKLLEFNTREYDGITAHNAAIGPADGRMYIQTSAIEANFGGASLYGVEVDPATSTSVEVWSPKTLLEKTGLDRVDLIKIDTEGAEYDILTSLPADLLGNVRWIIGELHGIHDFKLLDHLAPDFMIDVRKTLHKRFFRFNACNRAIIDRIPKNLVKWLQY